MTSHTELTAEQIDVANRGMRIAIDPSYHPLLDEICAQAKVGAGGAVAYMHGDGTLYSKVRGESLLKSGAQNIEPLYRCKPASTAQAATGTMRLGADKLERTRPNAEYWLSHGRKESDRDKAVMYVEQSSNAWKNAAYGLAEQLATKEAATVQAALPDGPPLHVAETLIYQIEHGTAFDTSVLLAVLRAHCLALRKGA